MAGKFAIVVIAADGATDIIGPYGSEQRARHNADAIRDEAEGISADVYVMDPPTYYREYVTESDEDAWVSPVPDAQGRASEITDLNTNDENGES